MDAETIATIGDIITKGGPVGQLVVMYFALRIAFKAGKTAQEAVKALTDLRDAAVKSVPLLEKTASKVENIEREVDEHNGKLDKLLIKVGVT